MLILLVYFLLLLRNSLLWLYLALRFAKNDL